MFLKIILAGKGDCFLLSWQNGDVEDYILIDGGTAGTYKFIRQEISERGLPKATIITHVDYDHIGGIGALFNDETVDHKEDIGVFVNAPSLILYPSNQDKVKIEHGIRFSKKLAELEIDPKGIYIGINDKEELVIGALKLIPLSPPKNVLQAFIDAWSALNRQQLRETNDLTTKMEVGSEKVSFDGITSRSYHDILGDSESVEKWEQDLLNASCMAFIAVHGNQRILFLGDSNPDLVAGQLEAMGYSRGNKLKVNLVKISHHGCRNNSTKRLHSLIKCRSFYLSTNGAGPYYHPHRETIVRICEYSRESTSQHITFYTNYKLDKAIFISPEEEINWNVSFQHKNVLDIRILT